MLPYPLKRKSCKCLYAAYFLFIYYLYSFIFPYSYPNKNFQFFCMFSSISRYVYMAKYILQKSKIQENKEF